jgi:hypothetical protein
MALWGRCCTWGQYRAPKAAKKCTPALHGTTPLVESTTVPLFANLQYLLVPIQCSTPNTTKHSSVQYNQSADSSLLLRGRVISSSLKARPGDGSIFSSGLAQQQVERTRTSLMTLDAPVVAPDNLLPHTAIGTNIQRERKAHRTSWRTQH